jgi:hypothetical protein
VGELSPFQGPCLGWNHRGHCPRPLSVTWEAQRCRDFLETVLPGLLEDESLDVRQKLWFQHGGYPEHYEEGAQQWLNATYPRWIRRRGPTAWPPRSPDLTPVDFFLWGRLEDHGYIRSRGKTSSSCDNGRCQHVKACSRECRAAHCRTSAFKWMEAAWNTYCNYEAPMAYHSIPCAIWWWRVSWKLKVIGQYFRLIIFNKESHHKERVHEFRFILNMAEYKKLI